MCIRVALVFWAFRTTPYRSTGETPYSLIYGTKTIIPLEVGLLTLRTAQLDASGNEIAMEGALDFVE